MQSRKGYLGDVTTVIQYTMVFGVTLMACTAVMGQLMKNSMFANSIAMQKSAQALTTLDYASVAITLGLFMLAIGLASQVRTNKIFLPITIIILAVDVVLAAVLSNVFVAIAKSSGFASALTSLPFVKIQMLNFPLIIGIGGLMVILALFTTGLESGERLPR